MSDQVLRFGPAGALVGICTPPDSHDPSPDAPAVLFLNAGLVHHVGPNRLWVRAARRLAARHIPSLRFDFSSIGDSPAREDNLPFDQTAEEETEAAMRAMESRFGTKRFTLVGLCSGAEMSFRVALKRPEVVAVSLINAPRYLDEPSDSVVEALEVKQGTHYYWRVALRNPRSWLKALSGKADYRNIMRALADRVGSSKNAAPAGGDEKDPAGFRALIERGVRLQLVFSEGDWGHDYVHTILGNELDDHVRRGAVEMEIVPASDHMLTPPPAQEQLLDALERWIVA